MTTGWQSLPTSWQQLFHQLLYWSSQIMSNQRTSLATSSGWTMPPQFHFHQSFDFGWFWNFFLKIFGYLFSKTKISKKILKIFPGKKISTIFEFSKRAFGKMQLKMTLWSHYFVVDDLLVAILMRFLVRVLVDDLFQLNFDRHNYRTFLSAFWQSNWYISPVYEPLFTTAGGFYYFWARNLCFWSWECTYAELYNNCYKFYGVFKLFYIWA